MRTTLVKNSIIYWLGRMGARSVSFLLLPVYTSHIQPAEWGVLSLLFVAGELVLLIFSFQASTALYRFWGKAQSEVERQRLAGAAFLGPLLLSSLAFLPVYVYADVCAEMLGIKGYGLCLQLFLLTEQLCMSVDLMQAEIRLRDAAQRFVGYEIAMNILIAVLSIAGVVVFKLGVLGCILGQLGAFVIMFSVQFPLFIQRMKPNLEWGIIVKMLSFSLPLIPSAAAMSSIHSIDRFFVQDMCGIDAVGIYAIGYKIGTLTSILFLAPFLLIWEPKCYDIARLPDASKKLGEVFTYVFAIAAGIGIALVGSAAEIVGLMTSESYQGAATIVPIIVLSYVIYSLDPVIRTGLLYHHRTKTIMAIVVCACIVNIAGNILLIPTMGMTGAAWATVAAFSVLVALGALSSHFVLPIQYQKLRLLGVVVLSGAYLGAASFVHSENVIVSLCVKGMLFLVYPISMVAMGIGRKELAMVLPMIRFAGANGFKRALSKTSGRSV